MIPGAKELAWGQIGGGAHEKKAARLACRPKSQKTGSSSADQATFPVLRTTRR